MITEALSWHWIFYVNLPVGAAAMVMIGIGLKHRPNRVVHRVDYLGALLLSVATCCGLLALSWGGNIYAWSSPTIVGLGGTAVLSIGLLTMHERQEVEPLEDTLPDLTAAELLPERRDRSIATGDLAKGLAIAATVLGIAHGLSSDDLGRDATAPTLVAGTATITGLVAFIHIRRHPEIPANVAANGERRERQRAANEAIKARNAAKIAATLLVVSPAAGVGP